MTIHEITVGRCEGNEATEATVDKANKHQVQARQVESEPNAGEYCYFNNNADHDDQLIAHTGEGIIPNDSMC